MRHFISLLALLSVMSWPSMAATAGLAHDSPPPRYASDHVLVKFIPGTPGYKISALAKQAGAKSLKVIPGIDVHVMQVPAGSVMAKVALFKHNPNVLFVEPDFNRILYIPNEGDDPEPTGTGNEYFIEQWALNNTGQVHSHPDTLLGLVPVTGAVDADIDAPEGWDYSTGDPGVKIAILDTGIDCRSGANPGGSLEFAMPTKCVEEVNFVGDYSPTVRDAVSHGTHVAGIAAAETDNDIGTAGVGFDSAVGNLKTCFEYEYDLLPPLGYYVIVGVCPVSASATAITYAADHGYQVINMSYASDQVDENGEPVGLAGPSATELAAVDYAWGKGLVLSAAAGNDDNTLQNYPAAYDNVIAVGATDHYDDRASFSTFGNDWVSLMAPGEDIISTVPNELCVLYADLLGLVFDPDNDACLDWYSGTSMASPHVAGAAALVWAHLFGAADPVTCTDSLGTPCNVVVRQQLENGADATGALGQNMLSWSQNGRLNLLGALTNTEPPPAPTAPTNLSATAIDHTQVDLSWTDNSDNEEGFRIMRDAVQIASLGADATAYSDTSVAPATSYDYQVFSFNGAGEAGSNTESATTPTAPEPPPPAEPPTAPSNLLARNAGDGTAILTWTDNSDNEASFEIERETKHPKNGKWVNNTILTVDPDVTDHIDTIGDGTYHYRIRAINDVGPSEWTLWGDEVTVTGGTSGGGGGGSGGGGGGKPCKGKKCP